MIDDPAEGLVTFCARELNHPKDDFLAVYRDYLPDFQKGRIVEQDLWKKVCGRLNVPVPSSPLYRRAVEHVFKARPNVFGLAGQLHDGGYKVGFLSNTELPAMEYFSSRGYDCFDAAVFSCLEHCAKPEAKIYEITCRRLGVEPHEAVFIDDRLDYLHGAKAVGMQIIRYECFEQVTGELKALGVRW